MTQPTDQTAPAHQRYAALIDEAEAAAGMLPTIDACRRLEDELRAAITDLADRVRREQGRLARDTIDWNVREQALLGAQAALCGGPGLGLRSAALHVATLGAAARSLADCIAG
ncbi:DUF6415 family natural product biosynthesis protein [Streptomyces rishiriensis]|uniref:DUF6415 family natural product biosynthesis protein n=1 Tax=Streptomyces rishiriensis TaxID=68264 RepID=UPI000D593BC6|nr:DUF6415 family natural product biosynthesis protein [Streptomyces rishiriensis]